MQDAFNKYLPWFILREIPFVGNVLFKSLIKKETYLYIRIIIRLV